MMRHAFILLWLCYLFMLAGCGQSDVSCIVEANSHGLPIRWFHAGEGDTIYDIPPSEFVAVGSTSPCVVYLAAAGAILGGRGSDGVCAA